MAFTATRTVLLFRFTTAPRRPANFPNTTTQTGGNFGYTASQLNANFTYDLGQLYNTSGLAWSHIEPPPPAGIHPRILFNPEDVPDIRSRLTSTTTEGPVLWATIQSFTRQLTNNGASWNAAFTDLSNGVTSSFAPRGDKNNMVECMSYEAFRCLIANDTVNAPKLCAALATVANYEYAQMQANPSGDWRNDYSFNLCFEGLGYAYDFAYNFMTPAQQQAVRQAITYGTTAQWSIGLM